MRFISINDLKLLVKKGLYQLETGSRPGDYLVYDRKARTYVGHVEGTTYDDQTEVLGTVGYFLQNEKYEPRQYIISVLDTFGKTSNWNRGDEW